ncbi:MAG: PPOX class F420-dependent oxidoreductase [Candidatus Promineifilaceae bacterium]
MTTEIPADFADLIDGPVVVGLTTLMRDGTPQTTPVWCNRDNGYVLINSAVGRQKVRNMKRDPRVTILAVDPDNPYRYLEIRGEVVETTLEGALEHINELARLYRRVPEYYGYAAPAERRQKEQRIMFKIRPERVNTFGRRR